MNVNKEKKIITREVLGLGFDDDYEYFNSLDFNYLEYLGKKVVDNIVMNVLPDITPLYQKRIEIEVRTALIKIKDKAYRKGYDNCMRECAHKLKAISKTIFEKETSNGNKTDY